MAEEFELLFCPQCQHEALAEAPPCADGHGDACPDRACVDCGTALLVDAPLFDLIAGRSLRTPGSTARGAHAA
ncbi:hypothetical protein [uncultured Jatrophihabitans sp.]|uniref:hypothetical protein n=1 Tax=uncultured Jatrophihabitans sp. TaxID=1610747 RepID=UPI0035C99DA8